MMSLDRRPIQQWLTNLSIILLALFVLNVLLHCHVNSLEWNEDKPRSVFIPINGHLNVTEKFVDMDAYRTENCGKVKLRPWQKRQHAIDCQPLTPELSYYSRSSFKIGGRRGEASRESLNQRWTRSTRKLGGRDMEEGEMTFYAHLTIEKKNGQIMHCAATILDYDFIVTAAQCVYDARFIKITLGSNDDSSSLATRVISDKWCYPRQYYPSDPLRTFDLAISRFKIPIDYSDKIKPACVSIDKRHHEEAACYAVGKVKVGNKTKLRAVVVKRSCPDFPGSFHHNSCYRASHEGAIVGPMEPGSPVVCYDACTEQAETRAFVVGSWSFGNTLTANSSSPKLPPGANYYSDFFQFRGIIDLLLLALASGTDPEYAICYEPPERP